MMTTEKKSTPSPAAESKRDAAFWFLTSLKAFLVLCLAALYFVLPAISDSMRKGDIVDKSAFYNRANADWFLISVFAVLPLIVSVAAPFIRQFQRGPRLRFRPLIFWCALIANVIYLNWFVPPLPGSKALPWRADLLRVQQISFALARYAETREGTLPPKLDELVDLGLLDAEKPVTSPPGEKGKAGKPYIYFPQITPDMPADCIVLASRFSIPSDDGQRMVCWFAENGWRVPTPWRNQGRGWGESKREIMKRINAQRAALDMINRGFGDAGQLQRALASLRNGSLPQLRRSIIAWALGAHKVKTAASTLKEVFNSGSTASTLKFECARALLRVGEVSDLSRPANWIASVKLSSLVPDAPKETDVPRIASVVEKLNSTAMDVKTFASEAGLGNETAREYLDLLARSMLLSRIGGKFRLARKGLDLLAAGKDKLEKRLEGCRQQHAVNRLKSDPPYLVRKQAIDALTGRFVDRLGYEPFLNLTARRAAARRWKKLFSQ